MEPRKPNLFAIPYEAPAREVVELTDPRRPEWRMTIELQAADPITCGLAEAICEEMVGRYLVGLPGMAAQPYMVGRKPARTTPEFWEDVAYICAMQPEDWSLGFSHYEAEEIAQLAFKVPHAWRQLGAAVRRLHAAGAAALPNASGVPEEG